VLNGPDFGDKSAFAPLDERLGGPDPCLHDLCDLFDHVEIDPATSGLQARSKRPRSDACREGAPLEARGLATALAEAPEVPSLGDGCLHVESADLARLDQGAGHESQVGGAGGSSDLLIAPFARFERALRDIHARALLSERQRFVEADLGRLVPVGACGHAQRGPHRDHDDRCACPLWYRCPYRHELLLV